MLDQNRFITKSEKPSSHAELIHKKVKLKKKQI